MPGTVGIVAKVLETIINKVFDEDQLPELMKRRKLASMKKECADALARNDWAELAAAVERLRTFSAKP
jgi:hypothetical protein